MKDRLVTLGVATLVALLVCEVLVRIFVPDPALQFENRPELFLEDDRLGYRNAPNYRAYAQGTIRVETNGLGFRGPETTTAKPAHTFRIVVLGDSVTWGVGVAEASTYPRVLEHDLNADLGAGSGVHVEVINTAVIGYSLHQERLSLERDATSLNPDLAIVGFVLNDFYPSEDPFFNVHKFHRPARSDVRRRPYPPTERIHSYFLRLLRSTARLLRNRTFWALRQIGNDVHDDPVAWPPPGLGPDVWSIMQEHFAAMKRIADEKRFRLLVVLFPSYLQYDPVDRKPQEQLIAMLTAAGIDFVDLFDAFRPPNARFFRDSLHFSKEGHGVAAQELRRAIDTRHWLPGAVSVGSPRYGPVFHRPVFHRAVFA